MSTRTVSNTAVVAAAIVGNGIVTAAPAAAGGIGDFLSPAFGTACANLNNGARAHGVTTQGTGIAGGDLAGLPIGSALNQCGGADLPIVDPGFRPYRYGLLSTATDLN
ncbi:hypothetical protein [Streptomyces flavidovirens]|uniref:Chaplin domain-containing protein n=1 Tax=Streptomyces flavidovirens TaxID=67298 RepID=A0ABW6RSY7_9ACTN